MLRARTGAWIVALSVTVFAGAVLTAQGTAASGENPSTPTAAQPPQDQFVPMKSLPQQEQLPAAPLLVTAYGFVWAVLLVYLWTIWRRLMKVEREMQQLSSRVAESAARR
jgi:CcmD family protein